MAHVYWHCIDADHANEETDLAFPTNQLLLDRKYRKTDSFLILRAGCGCDRQVLTVANYANQLVGVHQVIPAVL